MLQIKDKHRLDELLRLIETSKIRFPIAYLAQKTNTDKGNISNYLKGKKPIPDNFYTTVKNILKGEFCEVKSDVVGIQPEIKQLIESINGLVESNKTLSQSTAVISQTNAELVTMLKTGRSTENELSENLKEIEKRMARLGLMVTKAGTGGWHNEDEALKEVNTTLYGMTPNEKAKDNYSADRKRDKA